MNRLGRSYEAAQLAYDNLSPPEDGPSECLECDGRGEVPDADPEADYIECPHCRGFRLVDVNGEPYNPARFERLYDPT